MDLLPFVTTRARKNTWHPQHPAARSSPGEPHRVKTSLLLSLETPWLLHANPVPPPHVTPGFILCYIPHLPAFFPPKPPRKTPNTFSSLHGRHLISYCRARAEFFPSRVEVKRCKYCFNHPVRCSHHELS